MASTSVMLSQPWNSGIIAGQTSDINDVGMCEQTQLVARKELREDQTTREQCLEQMKEWIKQNNDIENIRVDEKFLLRFLRAKKFSIPMAQQTLLKYLNLKKTFPDMTTQLDFLTPAINQLISNGYIFVSPIRDKNGRRVVIAFAKNFDPNLHTCSDMARAHLLTYETLLEDPENQVLGVIHVGDMKGITAAHITCWNPTEFAKILRWGEHSLPMRHKEIHCVNVPQTVKYVIDFATRMVSTKIRERFMMHVEVQDLHEKVDAACLPKELGGTMSMAEMIESWKRELTSKRDLIVGLDNMKILSDRGIIRRDRSLIATSLDTGIEGSFRKLEVD